MCSANESGRSKGGGGMVGFARRLRRFSLRSLCLFVVAIAALWALTATWGADDVFSVCSYDVRLTTLRAQTRVYAFCPFILKVTFSLGESEVHREVYYVWFFGYVARLSPRSNLE